MVTREQLSENRVFDRTRPEYKESAIIALSEGLITDFSDSLGGAGGVGPPAGRTVSGTDFPCRLARPRDLLSSMMLDCLVVGGAGLPSVLAHCHAC